jgi:hypothetical protein
MTSPEFKEEVARLKRKLAKGDLTEDEFWEELKHLERSLEPPGDIDASEVAGSVGRGFLGIFMFFIPAIIGIGAVYLVLIYYPAPPDMDIRVESSSFIPAPKSEKEAIYRALRLMKDESPAHYRFVDSYVDTVEVAPPMGFSVFGVIKGYYRTDLGKSIRMVHGLECPAYCEGEGWTGLDLLAAEFIIHEACHSMQHHTGRPFSEDECYAMQFEFAKKVGPNLWSGFNEDYFVWDHTGGMLI